MNMNNLAELEVNINPSILEKILWFGYGVTT